LHELGIEFSLDSFFIYLDSQKRELVSECESDITEVFLQGLFFYSFFIFCIEVGLDGLGFALVVHTN
jgi:hypothetical protein